MKVSVSLRKRNDEKLYLTCAVIFAKCNFGVRHTFVNREKGYYLANVRSHFGVKDYCYLDFALVQDNRLRKEILKINCFWRIRNLKNKERVFRLENSKKCVICIKNREKVSNDGRFLCKKRYFNFLH